VLCVCVFVSCSAVACHGAVIYVPRSVNEGATTTLQVLPTATVLSPLQYKWDLDADGNYGEIGPSANHGDETGRFVLFTTVGRDGSRIPAGSWPVAVQIWYTSNSSPGTLQEQGSNSVTIANVAPSIDSTGGPYTATGAAAVLTARASDPGGTIPTVLWDLDLDGVFGETGAAAENGNEVGATVTFLTSVTEATRANAVRVKAFDGSLYSDIKTTTVNVPGLLSTHRCPCASQPTGQCAIGLATGAAVQVSSSDRKGSPQLTALTSRVTGAQTGGWFRSSPIVFDSRSMDGFHFCGSYVVLRSTLALRLANDVILLAPSCTRVDSKCSTRLPFHRRTSTTPPMEDYRSSSRQQLPLDPRPSLATRQASWVELNRQECRFDS